MRVLVRAFRPLTGVSPTPLHVLCFQYIFGQSKIRLLLRKEKKIRKKNSFIYHNVKVQKMNNRFKDRYEYQMWDIITGRRVIYERMWKYFIYIRCLLWYFLVSMKHRNECSVCFTIPAYLILHLSYLKKQILKWLQPLLFKKQQVAQALVWCQKGREDEAWFELGWITNARSY